MWYLAGCYSYWGHLFSVVSLLSRDSTRLGRIPSCTSDCRGRWVLSQWHHYHPPKYHQVLMLCCSSIYGLLLILLLQWSLPHQCLAVLHLFIDWSQWDHDCVGWFNSSLKCSIHLWDFISAGASGGARGGALPLNKICSPSQRAGQSW